MRPVAGADAKRMARTGTREARNTSGPLPSLRPGQPTGSGSPGVSVFVVLGVATVESLWTLLGRRSRKRFARGGRALSELPWPRHTVRLPSEPTCATPRWIPTSLVDMSEPTPLQPRSGDRMSPQVQPAEPRPPRCPHSRRGDRERGPIGAVPRPMTPALPSTRFRFGSCGNGRLIPRDL